MRTIIRARVSNDSNDYAPIVLAFHNDNMAAFAHLTVEQAQHLITEVAAAVSHYKQREATRKKGKQ